MSSSESMNTPLGYEPANTPLGCESMNTQTPEEHLDFQSLYPRVLQSNLIDSPTMNQSKSVVQHIIKDLLKQRKAAKQQYMKDKREGKIQPQAALKLIGNSVHSYQTGTKFSK